MNDLGRTSLQVHSRSSSPYDWSTCSELYPEAETAQPGQRGTTRMHTHRQSTHARQRRHNTTASPRLRKGAGRCCCRAAAAAAAAASAAAVVTYGYLFSVFLEHLMLCLALPTDLFFFRFSIRGLYFFCDLMEFRQFAHRKHSQNDAGMNLAFSKFDWLNCFYRKH